MRGRWWFRDRRGRASAALALLTALVLVACGGSSGGNQTSSTETTAPQGTYVARVSGTNAYIALITDHDRVVGYVCDGDGKSISVSRWLDVSPLSRGTAQLVDRRGNAVGAVTLTAAQASGSISIDGIAHDFSAEPATGKAGLYREVVVKDPNGKLEPGESETGWIVLNDGSVRGAKTFLGSGGTTSFSNPDNSPFTSAKATSTTSISNPDHSF